MFERFKILPQLVATGRLALRLLRDSRTPMAAKLILGATALYLASPIDVMPDWFPLFGQADDLLAVLAGLNLFIRACPRWLVEEHEQRLGRKSSPPRADGPVIEGRYRRVD
jgi:uncharacterized membrane protein YkvA (DUF1232 family)